MKIDKYVLPLVKKFIENNVDLIENEDFQNYIQSVYEYGIDNEDYVVELTQTLIRVLKECYDPQYILSKIDFVPNNFFNSEKQAIVIPNHIQRLDMYAIDVLDAHLIKFEKSDKPIMLDTASISVWGGIDCLEFNRPSAIDFDTLDEENSPSIKKFNIFSDIRFYTNRWSSPSGTVLDYVAEDGEINIKDGITIKINMFSSSDGEEIKEFLNQLGLENVNIV